MEFIAKQKALKNTYDLQRHNIKEELIKNGTKDTSGKLVKKPHNTSVERLASTFTLKQRPTSVEECRSQTTHALSI